MTDDWSLKGKNKIDEIINYLNVNRGVGHTYTEIYGLKNNDNAIAIVGNSFHKGIMGIPKNRVITINELIQLRGKRCPIIVDHYAMLKLFEEVTKNIETLYKKIVKDLQKWASDSDKYGMGEVIEPIRIVGRRFGVE